MKIKQKKRKLRNEKVINASKVLYSSSIVLVGLQDYGTGKLDSYEVQAGFL